MPAPLQARGFDAEARALELLRRHGLRPVDRNVRFKAGEIDLIMRDGVEWVFIEVRSRGQARFGGAAASVGWRKQQRLASPQAPAAPFTFNRHACSSGSV